MVVSVSKVFTASLKLYRLVGLVANEFTAIWVLMCLNLFFSMKVLEM